MMYEEETRKYQEESLNQSRELNETMKRIRFELRDLVAVLKEMKELKKWKD